MTTQGNNRPHLPKGGLGRIERTLINDHFYSVRASGASHLRCERGEDLIESGDMLIGPAEPLTLSDADFAITFGSDEAKITIVKHFSLSCRGCLDTIRQLFPKIEEKYIVSGKIRWVFVPMFTDLLTLRLTTFLESVSPKERRHFIRNIPREADGGRVHEDDITLELYFSRFGIPRDRWIDKMCRDARGTLVERELRRRWIRGELQAPYNYSITFHPGHHIPNCEGESHWIHEEPTLVAIESIITPYLGLGFGGDDL